MCQQRTSKSAEHDRDLEELFISQTKPRDKPGRSARLMDMRAWGILFALSFCPAAFAVEVDLGRERQTVISDLVTVLREPQYYLHSDKKGAGTWALECLVKIGKPAIPALMRALEIEDTNVRAAAAQALVKLEAREAIPALKSTFLSTKDTYTRRRLLEAIARLGRSDAFSFVLQTLDSNDPDALAVGISALGETGDALAVPMLAKLLFAAPSKKTSKGADFNREAAWALSNLGAPGLETLRQAFHSSDENIRVASGSAVFWMTDPAGVPLILEVIASADARERRIQVHSTSHPAVKERLGEMLASDDLASQLTAARAFDLGDPKIGIERILRRSLRTVPGESRRDRRELIIRLVDFEESQKYQKPAPAIRAAIDWMLGPGGYTGVEVAPLMNSYWQSAVPADADLILRLSQVKSPEKEPFSGSTFSEDMSTSTERAAAYAIGTIGAAALTRLRALWKKGAVSDEIYGTAVMFTDDAKALDLVLEAAHSSSKEIRSGAVRALGSYATDPRTLAVLLTLREDKECKDDVYSSLMELAHEPTVLEAAKEEYLDYRFEFLLEKVSPAFLTEIVDKGSRKARACAAGEMVKRKLTRGYEVLADLAVTAPVDEDELPEVIEKVAPNEALFVKCLKSKSIYLRAIGLIGLEKLSRAGKT